jgi:hypothetical protein
MIKDTSGNNTRIKDASGNYCKIEVNKEIYLKTINLLEKISTLIEKV